MNWCRLEWDWSRGAPSQSGLPGDPPTEKWWRVDSTASGACPKLWSSEPQPANCTRQAQGVRENDQSRLPSEPPQYIMCMQRCRVTCMLPEATTHVFREAARNSESPGAHAKCAAEHVGCSPCSVARVVWLAVQGQAVYTPHLPNNGGGRTHTQKAFEQTRAIRGRACDPSRPTHKCRGHARARCNRT